MKLKHFIGTLCLSSLALVACTQQEAYRNPDLIPSERAWDLLKRMTLDEKINQMKNGADPVERLGIPQYDWWNEALHGVGRAGLATVFPQAIGLAATFDEQAVYETFDMVSDEARAKYNDFQQKGERTGYKGLTFWTPNVNIFRDPRWGRGQETYGEDPYLTTRMGLAVVRGLQGDGTQKYDKTHACAKHYAVHSGPEWNRHSFDAKNIAPRDLYETYLPAFKALVTEGKVKEEMCAYNRFEGEPCCSNKELLIRILREEWNYDDIVVSDCGAISDFYRPQPKNHGTHASAAEASADAVLSGTDLNCGGSYGSLKEAVEKGIISESKIDESVFRLLRARFQLGMFDDPATIVWNKIPYSVVNSAGHQAKALEIPQEKIVETGIIDIALRDIHGNVRKLTDLKGKVVLLDFSVFQSPTGAPHNMLLRELYNKYASQGLEIYQISLDADEHYWKTAAANLPWICVRDGNGVYSTNVAVYNVRQVPSIFLINRNNELKLRGEDIKDLEASVKSLL